jgi:hypothetical protein
VIGACVAFISNRFKAYKARKGYLASVQGYAGAEELSFPRSGLFKGDFQQGSAIHWMEVNLDFLKREDLKVSGHPVALYEVVGEGSDSFGTWRVKRGECRVGSSVVLTFYKSYLVSTAHTTEFHRLMYVCHMQLEDWTGASFFGTWEFVNKATPPDGTPMIGRWSLQFSPEQSLQTPSDSTPLLLTINLTKGHSLPV